jgi:tetratricopeptide (TPR) repeat protein
MLRSKVYEVMEDHEKAIADLDKAIELESDDAAPLLDRAWLRIQMNDLTAARTDVERVLDANPTSSRALMMRSMISELQNRFREAIADLETVINEFPDKTELQLHMARLLISDERPRKAISVLTSIVEADESNWEAYRTRADALLSVGKHAEAIEDYTKGLKLKPDDDGILNNLAWVLATSPFDHLRDARRSIELAKKACEETNYEMPHILSTLAAGYAEAGEFETAIKWSTMAVEKGKTELKNQIEQLEQELESYKSRKPWREMQEVKEKPDPPRHIIET